MNSGQFLNNGSEPNRAILGSICRALPDYGWCTECRHNDNSGTPVPHRPAEDIAFSVARFIQKGGSYMYHGGTYFGRTGLSSPLAMTMMLHLMNMAFGLGRLPL